MVENTVRLHPGAGRFLLTTFLAWLVFLALDFLAHATLLQTLWAQDIPALRTPQELFQLIPFGYASFLILTVMMGTLCLLIVPRDRFPGGALKLGTAAGAAFALSNGLAWYSVFDLPGPLLFLTSLVYWVELTAVAGVYGWLLPASSLKKRAWWVVGSAVLLVALSIVLQNLIAQP
jgi:hypothetical protein